MAALYKGIVALIIWLGCIQPTWAASTPSPYPNPKVYNLTQIFDFAVLQELNQRAEDLWTQLLEEYGSEERILLKIYQAGSPDPRLRELHENVLQMIKTSQFRNVDLGAFYFQEPSIEFKNIIGKSMHPLLREVVSNIRSYAFADVSEILNRPKVAGFVFKSPYFHRISGLLSCTFNNCDAMPEFKGKFSDTDLAIGLVYFYSDVIASFDLATWDCQRYLSANSAKQNLSFVNRLGPLGNRTMLEGLMLAPFCVKVNSPEVPGTPASRAALYLSKSR